MRASLAILLTTACMSSMFADLVERAKLEGAENEAAAFIVEKEGELSCLLWPSGNSRWSKTYKGVMPENVIAVAHTHPEIRGMQAPSAGDSEAAQRLGLPFYVITRWEVWVANPEGRRKRVPMIPQRGSCRCNTSSSL
jgi:hypothetical protein